MYLGPGVKVKNCEMLPQHKNTQRQKESVWRDRKQSRVQVVHAGTGGCPSWRPGCELLPSSERLCQRDGTSTEMWAQERDLSWPSLTSSS